MNDAAAIPESTDEVSGANVDAQVETDGAPRAPVRLGHLPLLSVTTAVGLNVAAVADSRARLSDPNATLIFWIGLLLIFLPNAVQLLSAGASRVERVGSVLLVGGGLYLVKLAASPLMFSYFDEFLHMRTAEDIVLLGRLYTPNSLLTVSPQYPGLESATSALSLLGGMSVFQAGIVLLAVGRIVFAVTLFLFYEGLSGSARLAGLAALVYMANPSFIFFSAQFGYESLALPFAVMTLYLVFRRGRSLDRGRTAWVMILPMIAATVVTHHVTGFVLSGLLVAWAVIDRTGRRRSAASFSLAPLRPALVTAGATIFWLLAVASTTIDYLAPAIQSAVTDVLRLVLAQSGPRQLFRGVGPVPPVWESMTGYLSIALVMAALLLGIRHLFRLRPWNSLQVTLALSALAYPATQAARLTAGGAELSARTTTFLYLAVGFVVALAVAAPPFKRVTRLWRFAIPGLGLTVLFVGSVVIAVPIWMRLPGPYLVGADPRSVEPESVASAQWALVKLGEDHRFLSDRTNRLLLGAIGLQHPVTAGGDRINLRPAFFATTLRLLELGDLRAGRVQYVLVDRRLSTALPLVGVYTERGEANDGPRTTPIDPAALGKYDSVRQVSRIYDSGNIQIYDIEALTNARSQPSP